MSNIENFDIRTQVIDAVVETFDTMVSMEIEVSDSEPPEADGLNRLVASVNFAGSITGQINFQVPAGLWRAMMANVLDTAPEETENEDEIKDLLAETSNVIAGKLKSSLVDAGHPCVISPPCLTYGTDFNIKSLSMDRSDRYVFACRGEFMVVEVDLKVQQYTGERDDFGPAGEPGKLENIDIEKLNALVSEAVIDVFDTMLSARLEPMDAIPSGGLEDRRNVGSVSFAGDAAGMVSIHAGDNFTRALAAEMLGIEDEALEGDEEIRNMLGEVGNIVGGNLKSAFTDAGLACALSTPTFTAGTDFKIESLNMEKYERFAFRSDDNIVLVEMGLQGKDFHKAVSEDASRETLSEEDIAAALAGVNEVQETDSAESPLGDHPQSDPAVQSAEGRMAGPAHAPPVQDAAPQSAQSRETRRPEDFDLDLLLDIPLEIKVELGRTKIQLQDLLKLSPGSAVKLVKLEGEPVDILANETLIARGEVVVQNEKYGIRVTEITSRMDRIRSFGI